MITSSLVANWRLVLLGMLMSTMTTVCFYMVTAYTPTFGRPCCTWPRPATWWSRSVLAALNFVPLPVSGGLSDRVGRRPVLLACAAVALATAYPGLSWLVDAPSFARLLAVELWLAAIYATYNGAMAVFLTEIMPVDVRTSGLSLAYSLATAMFGGFTPAICTHLVHLSGNRAIPGLWLSFAAICGLVAVSVLSPKKHEKSQNL